MSKFKFLKGIQGTVTKLAGKGAKEVAEEGAEHVAKQTAKNAIKEDLNLSTKKLRGKRYNSKEGYLKYKVGKEYDDVAEKLSDEKFSSPILDEIRSRNNLNSNKEITSDMLKAERRSSINNVKEDDMSMKDMIGYYKVPQRAAAIGGSLFLASKVMHHGGEQSNASLYGQQQNY